MDTQHDGPWKRQLLLWPLFGTSKFHRVYSESHCLTDSLTSEDKTLPCFLPKQIHEQMEKHMYILQGSMFRDESKPMIQILLMEEFLQELIGSLSHNFQGFIHPR